MTTPAVNPATASLHSLTDQIIGMVWPVAVAIVLAGLMRVGVFAYMTRAGFTRRRANLVSYLAFAALLLAFALAWRQYFLAHP